jgi:y4mF family transcriptional regulator
MKYTPKQIGEVVRQRRKRLGVTQKDLALTSGTGLRFIIDLEKGKPTCQIGKVLTVLHTLGIKIKLIASAAEDSGADSRPGVGAKEKR